METLKDIIEWFTKTENLIGLSAALYGLECFIAFVSRLTPWKWDDNIAGAFGSLLAKVFPKK